MFFGEAVLSQSSLSKPVSFCTRAASVRSLKTSLSPVCSSPACSPGHPACSDCQCGWATVEESGAGCSASWECRSARSKEKPGLRELPCGRARSKVTSSTCSVGGKRGRKGIRVHVCISPDSSCPFIWQYFNNTMHCKHRSSMQDDPLKNIFYNAQRKWYDDVITMS